MVLQFSKSYPRRWLRKKRLKSSNTFRQLLPAVTAFVLEDQLEIHIICTVTQNIMREAPKEPGNGMAEFGTHMASPLQPVMQQHHFHTITFPAVTTI